MYELKMEYERYFIERCQFWNENDTPKNIIHSSIDLVIQHLSIGYTVDTKLITISNNFKN